MPNGECQRGGLRLSGVAIAVVFLCCASCTQLNYEDRNFFQEEYGLETHGRKTWFDHLVEVDPGGIDAQVASNYEDVAPPRVAVLPFVDLGSTNFVVDKVPLTFRNKQESEKWAWTDANRMRRDVSGYLSEREFIIANLIQVDEILKLHGIHNEREMYQLSAPKLGQWLDVDAVIYGEVTSYEAYYGGLIAAWRVGTKIRMISTHNGQKLFVAHGSRWSVDLRPAFDMIDIAVNSGLTLLELRDVTLARAEEEDAREIALRIPRSHRLEAELIRAVRDKAEAQKFEAGTNLQSAKLAPP